PVPIAPGSFFKGMKGVARVDSLGRLARDSSQEERWPRERAAVLRDPAMVTGIGQFAVIQSVAPSVGVEVTPINSGDAGEIERAVTTFARSGNSGLIVT